jgi:hypothetical protein
MLLIHCVALLTPAAAAAAAGAPAAGQAKFSPVDLNTSSLKMYWGVAKQAGGQELWRELLQVRRDASSSSSCSSAGCNLLVWHSMSIVLGSSTGGCANIESAEEDTLHA